MNDFSLPRSLPQSLSGEWPAMPAAMRERVQTLLADGCTCGGTATLVRRLVAAHVNVYLQCDACGRALGGAMSRREHPYWQGYAEWDAQRREDHLQRQTAEWDARYLERQAELAAKAKTAEQQSAEYAEWLRTSPEWKALAGRVRQRANHTCEACLEQPGRYVHHLTYRLGVLPPAWELRAVCYGCHQRLHADKHGLEDEWAGGGIG